MPEGIPSDPRQRTKNHARVEITVWVDMPDNVIAHTPNAFSAADALRINLEKALREMNEEEGGKGKETLISAIKEMTGIPIVTDVTYRVGQ